MKVLFAVSDENVAESVVKKYQQMYKEIILSKNVYYFNAIIKELQKDKTYDRIVISEDLEPFANNNYDAIDNFIFEKLDNISDEATTNTGEDIPIILITTDRRTKSDNLLIKLFGIGVYSALLEQDRSIEQLCKLIQKPRSKKEAKVYYQIASNEVEYKPENEGTVSETEIQNILSYYKRLGRNEDRYSEVFDDIAAQYTDQQLKVIIKFLPLNVKAILEGNNRKYQQLTSFDSTKQNNGQANKTKLNNNTSKTISNSGIKVESIQSGEKRPTKPVIIPSMNRKAKKISNEETTLDKELNQNISSKKENNIKKSEKIIEEPKRRGRPKKVKDEEIENIEEIAELPKKRRGRPKKVEILEEDELLPETEETFEQQENIFPGFEDLDDNEVEFENDETENNILPGFEDIDDNEPSKFENEDNDEVEFENDIQLPYDEFEDESENQNEINNEYLNKEDENIEYEQDNYYTDYDEYGTDTTELDSYEPEPVSIQGLLSQDKKVVAFIGTSKNGTSFLINNIADMLSKQGIRTAILDLTQNKNAYYIYTNNEEEKRKTAINAIDNLIQGNARGIKINNNLDVYTSLPGEQQEESQEQSIIKTLLQNYSLILLDCDFKTSENYLKIAQEIYLVQSMDVLTIQPLTLYLRDLKQKGILQQNKLRVVINKFVKLRYKVKDFLGGMSFYNSPAMDSMTELYDRLKTPYTVIPFNEKVYTSYLDGLTDCKISVNSYPADFINELRKLANMVYPLVGSNKNAKYSNPKYNKFANNNTANNINSTLDKMRNKY